MLKPVTILALDDVVEPLAHAVQQRIEATLGVEDLVQARAIGDLAQTIPAIHARRQRPDSPLRVRDDVSTRELVLVMLSACGPARTTLLETTRQIRTLYETRRLASFLTIEILCLLPEVVGSDDYAAAYALLKSISAQEHKRFDAAWLLDATNGSRVRFGALDVALDTYADAIAGALTYEPELSGALPGIHPRGMHPTFSSFGYASLVFPRDAALHRIQSRFIQDLITTKLMAPGLSRGTLASKQFVAHDAFALPLSRIGVEAGQSLFRRFQAKTQVTERTRGAEELIAATRAELQAFRDSTHLKNLETLAKQGEQTIREHAVLLDRTVDETLDRAGYDAAIQFGEALLDPLPELRPDAELDPRNLVTEIRAATSALDARLQFTPNTAASYAARKRVRELETQIQDQRLVADTVVVASASESLEEMEREKASLLEQIPEILFAEAGENNAARTAAREAEAVRLASETTAREGELRELFAQLPRAEQALREALEMRRAWLWKQVFLAAGGVALMYAIPFAFDASLRLANRPVLWAVALFAIVTVIRYVTRIAPLVRAAREHLASLRTQIVTTDQAKNAAHNAELQFEYDITHRRATLRVLRALHDAAKETLSSLRTRRDELASWSAEATPPLSNPGALSLPVIDEPDLDAWYDRTVEDRAPFLREFPITRSLSRRLPLDDLRQRVAAYAATAFAAFGKLTLAGAASTIASEAKLARRLKRFTDTSAPLIEVRDDDLPAQKSMQRDCTLWIETGDAPWTAQLQRRFPDAHVKASADPLSAHAVTRVLHYPGYVLGQIEYYRAQYEAAAAAEAKDAADLLPPELIVSAPVRAAYEQVLLARALGVVVVRGDGALTMSDASAVLLGDSHLTAAQTLASPESASFREQLEAALTPRLEIAADVTRELRSLRQSVPLTALDRTVLDALLQKYA